MCGIAGIYKFKKQSVKKSEIDNMVRTMHHRGPDDNGIFLEDNIALGFVRLSIIDLSKDGHQPMSTPNNRHTIVFNGEIFNYIELRDELIGLGINFQTKTDTEVLLHAYLTWGEDCLNKLNGMWAFAIYDSLNKTIFAARDRFGIKPFYYLNDIEKFAFCSEIPPLLPLLNSKPKPDNQSIFDFLVFNRTDQTENTFFKEIKKLQHGCKIFIKENEIKISKWYSLKEQVFKTKGFNSPEEYKNLFKSSIELRLRSDVPIGVCLSGGLDSSSIVSVLLKEFNFNNLNTFSAVYNKGQIGDETEFIKEFESDIKNMHYVKPTADSLMFDLNNFIKAHAEPIPTTGPYAQYKVMELARGKVVVTLDGQGADEQLAGYHYFFGFYYKDLLRSFKIFKLISEIWNYIINHKSIYGLKTFFYFLLPDKIKTKVRVDEFNYLHASFTNLYKNNNSVAENIYGSNSLNEALIDHFEYKLEHLLKWEDRNSMHFSLEARVPFLDYRLVEKTLASKNEWKIRKGMTKFILREALKGVLPEKIRLRKDKIGYGTPEDEWFRDKKWQDFILDILNSKSFASRGIINPEKSKELYKRHLKNELNVSKEIWKWIHLELWFREFIDN